MSRIDNATEEIISLGGNYQEIEAYPNREVELGTTRIWRALPIRGRRMVGPWCFLDRFGPLTFDEGKPMDVAPHPHMGLQTVSWLLDGEVLHNDSLGYEALLKAGEVNVMTSGSGIAHSEQTPRRNSGKLNGVQLWVALPDDQRNAQPDLQHLVDVPELELPGGIVHLFSGTVENLHSPAVHYSDIVGMEINLHAGQPMVLGLNGAFEHSLLVLSGDCTLERQGLDHRVLYYMPPGRDALEIVSREGARLLLLGGRPFADKILMWWNFVARTPDEIMRARNEWEEGIRFGDVAAYRGARLAAPDLSRLASTTPSR